MLFLGYDHPQCQTARKCSYKDLAVWATVVHEPDCKDFVAWVHSAEGKRLIESNYNWQKKPPNYETMRQKLRAEMKQVRDENAKQRAEEAANPETVLKAAYKNYIGVKVCYELGDFSLAPGLGQGQEEDFRGQRVARLSPPHE